MIISLGIVIDKKDEIIERTEVKLGHCQVELEEGFASCQGRTLKLEEEKRNRWDIHDGTMKAQHTAIQMQQEKIKKLEERRLVWP